MNETEIKSAIVSEDGLYRYELVRWWDEHNPKGALWVLCNPSTADHQQDDPTIRRCRNFARAWGLGGMVVVNLYAYRASTPDSLYRVKDPRGPENAAMIRRWLASGTIHRVIAGWGGQWRKALQPRLNVESMAREYGRTVMCLGLTPRSGDPRHPLYVKNGTPLVPLEKAA